MGPADFAGPREDPPMTNWQNMVRESIASLATGGAPTTATPTSNA
jgi:hypothetical protein